MKKVFYLIALIAVWILVTLLIPFLLLIFHILPNSGNVFGNLGSYVIGFPLWMVSGGITMLLRPLVYRMVYGETKVFNKSTALIFVVCGIPLYLMNVISERTSYNVSEKVAQVVANENLLSSDKTVSSDDSKIDNMFINSCKQINQQTPIYVDELTKLISMTYASRTVTMCYSVDIDSSSLTEEEVDELCTGMKSALVENVYKTLTKMRERDVTLAEQSEFMKKFNLRWRYLYKDKNESVFGDFVITYKDLQSYTRK